MEKAILKTLIYADIFDYPLKAYEIHKWLIGTKATLRQVEKALYRLSQKLKIQSKKDYFFLKGKSALVIKRINREKQSKIFFWKAKYIAWFLKLIPTIKLIGLSGGLALNNAEKSDDIDLFFIVGKDRIWFSRILTIFFLNAMGVRRKPNMKVSKVAGKICTNILVEEDKLEQINKDLFTAHEVLQMKVLWQRQGVYPKYLLDNSWAFEFLPNWLGNDFSRQPRSIAYQRKHPAIVSGDLGYARSARLGLATLGGSLLLSIEGVSKKFQLKIMEKPKGMERIEDGSLYFHPNDIRSQVLKEYRQRVKNV